MLDVMWYLLAGGTLAVHLLLMNVASAAPLLAMALEWTDRAPSSPAQTARLYLARSAVFSLLLGMVLGLVHGWVVYAAHGAQLTSVLHLLRDRIYWGVWELLTSLVLLGIVAVWGSSRSLGALPLAGRSLLGLASSANLLYHFPPLFALATRLAAEGPHADAAPLKSAQYRAAFFDPQIASHWLHFALAALATSGIMLLKLAARQEKKGQLDRARLAGLWGSRVALAATLVQIPSGLWLLAVAPPAAQAKVFWQTASGSVADWFPPLALLASVGAAVALMHTLAICALGAGERKLYVRAVLLLTAIVWAMAAVLVSIRGELAAGFTSP